MPHPDARARAALLPAPEPRPRFAEVLPDWEFPPSYQDFAQARRRALESLALRPPDPPRESPADDDGEEDTNPGDRWAEVAP